MGYISGDDGNRYQFSGTEWKENHPPQKGDCLDFDVNAAGQAVFVFLSLNPSAQSAHESNMEVAGPELEAKYAQEDKYNMFDWFIKCIKNYCSFSGRARRKEYWYFQLCYIFGCGILNILCLVLQITIIPVFIFAIVMSLPALGVTFRRLHDTNRSGWWLWILFVPVIGSILLIVWLASDTTDETNKWGAPAKPRES